MSTLDEITSLFGRHGAQSYCGESVSMAEHSLQTAHAGQLVVVGSHCGLGPVFTNQFACAWRPSVTYVLSPGVTSHD
jgi:hypothetical protein